jgi:hypothetical protein
MYERWFPATEQRGRTLLLVGFKATTLDLPNVRASATTIGPIEEHNVTRAGRIIRRYYTRVLEGYRGPPP